MSDTSPCDNDGDINDVFYCSDGEVIKGVFIPFTFFSVSAILYSCYLFNKNKTLFPIKGRFPEMVISMDLISSVILVIMCAHSILLSSFPCWVHFTQHLLFSSILEVVYLTRLVFLLFKFELTAELASYDKVKRQLSIDVSGGSSLHSRGLSAGGRAQLDKGAQGDYMAILEEAEDSIERNRSEAHRPSQQEEYQRSVSRGSFGSVGDRPGALLALFSAHESFYRRYRWFGRSASVGTFALSLLMFLTLPGWLILAFGEAPRNVGGNCQQFALEVYVSLMVGIGVVVITVMAICTRDVVEGFFIVRELWFTVLTAGTMYATWVSLVFAMGENAFPFQDLLSMMIIVTTCLWSTVYPYRLTQQRHDSPQVDELDSLEGVLAYATGNQLFKAHMAREFSLENVVFVEEIDALMLKCREMVLSSASLQLTREEQSSPLLHQPSADSSGLRTARDLASSSDRPSLSIQTSGTSTLSAQLNPPRLDDEDDDADILETPQVQSYSFLSAERKHSDRPGDACVTPGNRRQLIEMLGDARRPGKISFCGEHMHLLSLEQKKILWAQALNIYAQFVESGAAYEVNLPYYIRSRLETVFAEARKGVASDTSFGALISAEEATSLLDSYSPPQVQLSSSSSGRMFAGASSSSQNGPSHRPLLASMPDLAVQGPDAVHYIMDARIMDVFVGGVFAAARADCMELMQRDSFARFVASEVYRQWRGGVEQEQRQRRAWSISHQAL